MKSALKLTVALSALLLAGCGQNDTKSDAGTTSADKMTETAMTAPELGSFGIDMTAQKASVTPGDDFFRYANGTWLDTFELPADRSNYGAFTVLSERSEDRVKTIVDDLASVKAESGTVDQLVSDYFKSWMNVERANELGIAPLSPVLDTINAVASLSDLAHAFGASGADGTISPIVGGVGVNRLNPDEYQMALFASGLGLPDRDYYLEDNDRFMGIRTSYSENIAKLLGFTGMSGADAEEMAGKILSLETKIAAIHWPRADRRDRDKTLNPTSMEMLKADYAGFDWDAFFKGVGRSVDLMNMSHPSAVKGLIDLINSEDMAVWKAYLTYHAISNHAFLLGDEIDQANFEFHGKVLGGLESQRERWKRGVTLMSPRSGGLGEALGRIYVERYFPQAAKDEMENLVENLRVALGQRIRDLDWMGGETQAKALEKLAAFNPKIGYPNKWQDYSGLTIKEEDLFGNYTRLRAFYDAIELARLDRPTDRDEWFMTPQTVNAYYNPSFNEIVFPAAILQPPFFDLHADAAVNYGGIGAVIGHEMGHGFDDQGSKSDAKGVQTDWWTETDRANFEGLADKLVAQYNEYEAVPENFVDGRFTLGENIGDVGGLSMAYHAYKLSLDGKEAPVIDGLTGDQRFFLAWAQVWKRKYREADLLSRLKSDPHSPSEFRVNGVVRNMDAWYKAFGVTEDSALYLPPQERVTIW